MQITVSSLKKVKEILINVDENKIGKELLNINMLHENGKLEGEFKNISNEAYHSHLCPHDSRSTLMIARSSIAKYKAKKQGNMPWTTSPSKEFGSMCHEFILEPEEFKKNFADPYPIPRPLGSATKLAKNGGCKEAYIEWKNGSDDYEGSLNGKKIVSSKEMSIMTGIRDSIMSVPLLRDVLSSEDIEFENTYFFTDPKSGFQMKFRPDIIIKSKNIIIDFKTAIDASPLGFGKAMAQHGYDIQGAQYLRGAETIFGGKWTMGFIASEKEAPFVVGLHGFGEAEREVGDRILDETIQTIQNMPPLSEVKNCYSLEFKDCPLPSWAYGTGYR